MRSQGHSQHVYLKPKAALHKGFAPPTETTFTAHR
jgi:hypothetical protein